MPPAAVGLVENELTEMADITHDFHLSLDGPVSHALQCLFSHFILHVHKQDFLSPLPAMANIIFILQSHLSSLLLLSP